MIRAGGVPEHYNLPWHWAFEHHLFHEQGLDVQWKSYAAGTGAMARDFRSGKLDVAVLLTEGIIAEIAEGNPSRVVQIYVQSPLRWGVHTGYHSGIRHLYQLEGQKFAISRYNSGSHLMAYVLAATQNWKLGDESFEVVEDIEGARKALAENRAQAFLWEKFTTKYLVDSGEFVYLGDCFTPWPSFVIAASLEMIEHHEGELVRLLDFINDLTRVLHQRKDIIAILCKKYQLKVEDAEAWFHALTWRGSYHLNQAESADILKKLSSYRFIPPYLQAGDVFYSVDHTISR